VDFLIENGADVNAQNSRGEFPLHAALDSGHLDIVKFLIANGADVNAQNSDGKSLFYQAIASGHLDIVKFLIANGADVDPQNSDGKSLFYQAIEAGHLDIVDFLIENGADVNAPQYDGKSPLHIAIWNVHLDLVKLLIEHGADVNAQNSDGYSPLYTALYSGHLDIVKLLIENGADVESLSHEALLELVKIIYPSLEDSVRDSSAVEKVSEDSIGSLALIEEAVAEHSVDDLALDLSLVNLDGIKFLIKNRADVKFLSHEALLELVKMILVSYSDAAEGPEHFVSNSSAVGKVSGNVVGSLVLIEEEVAEHSLGVFAEASTEASEHSVHYSYAEQVPDYLIRYLYSAPEGPEHSVSDFRPVAEALKDLADNSEASTKASAHSVHYSYAEQVPDYLIRYLYSAPEGPEHSVSSSEELTEDLSLELAGGQGNA
jgi:ankyrin repeat protein